ncbi:MAG: FMN-binding protein [Ruminococcus sp.]|nr:FMN-binding protein [Ruminococcus sp.]MCM1381526.1 FMN-binding protein [Muribaculaceae bacterium]MCM1479228.1 FMN-binding protein [Muribaculaceae bacterium]
MFQEKIKPPLVLTLICIITCGLLVMAYEATYVDTTGVITEKLTAGLTEVYGSAEGFEMLKNADGTVLTYDGVTSVLSDGANTAFEITADGYSSGGLHVLVGLNESGAVNGVSVMTIGETPGVGTKVQGEDFRNQFIGVLYGDTVSPETAETSAKAKAVWGTREEINRLKLDAAVNNSSGSGFTLDAISGATFSSNGMYTAVKTALSAYEEMKGANE